MSQPHSPEEAHPEEDRDRSVATSAEPPRLREKRSEASPPSPLREEIPEGAPRPRGDRDGRDSQPADRDGNGENGASEPPPRGNRAATKQAKRRRTPRRRGGDRAGAEDPGPDRKAREEARGEPRPSEGARADDDGAPGSEDPRERDLREGDSERKGDYGPEDRFDDSGEGADEGDEGSEGGEGGPSGERPQRKTRKQRYLERKEREREREAALLDAAVAVDTEGIVEISPKGFGFVRERVRGFAQSPKDAFITPEVVREFGLRDGMWVKCVSKQGLRGPQLVEMLEINGRPPAECVNLPFFEELTAINPDKKLTLETGTGRATTRVIDLVAPVGRGQRGLIVAPPRTGKTTLLHHIAEGILQNYEDEIHLMVVLVDERPEEVTDFQRSFPDVEVYSSSNDSDPKDHLRIALLAIERAKRLVEAGDHVFILMDSITRLARASNSAMRGGGSRGIASGGLIVGALELPRRIFAAARNTREAGSLTIVATALIQTNSKADEAIFQEFKGTGNMELILDRQISQNYVYPAVDIHKSGTRREELLLPKHVLEKIYIIRRGLGGYRPLDAMEWLLKCLQRYPTNAQMLMDIKTTALS